MDGVGGCCLLDYLPEPNLIDIIQRDPVARADLLKVTSDPYLLNLAATLPSLPTMEAGDKLQIEVNKQAETIPFYAIFRGQPPFAQ